MGSSRRGLSAFATPCLLAAAAALALGFSCHGTCQLAATPGAPGGGGPPDPAQPAPLATTRLVDLPEAIKLADLRVTPPRIERLTARRAPDGGTLVEVQLAADPRLRDKLRLPLLADQRGGEKLPAPELRDDGAGGDATAGDGIFTMSRGVPFDFVRAEQQRMRQEAARTGVQTIPIFEGRQRVATRKLEPIRDLERLDLLHSLPGFVDERRSLFVTAPAVVEDPLRTAHPCSGAGAPMGAWSFGRLMTELAGPVPAAAFTEAFFDLLGATTSVEVNHLPAPSRNVAALLSRWPRTAGGALDLARAPMKLLAIVNRIDLAGNVAYGRAGGAEARLVFQAMDPTTADCRPLRTSQIFLLILEYSVPRDTCAGLRDWAQAWKHLSTLTPGSAAYNDALAVLVEEVVRAGAMPGRPHGSALSQLRTNEAAFGGRWDLRELRLVPGALQAVSVRQTPALAFNGGHFGPRAADLATWVNAHAAAVLAHRHTVPDFLAPGGDADPFLGPFASNFEVRKLVFGPAEEPNWLASLWRAPGISSSNLRHAFSLDTCDGCHGRETETTFVQVGTPQAGTLVGQEAQLSSFLTGGSVRDPDDPAITRQFDDLERRAAALQDFAEADCFDVARPELVQRPPGLFFVPMPPLAIRPTVSTH